MEHKCNCGAGEEGNKHHEVSCRIYKNYEAEAPEDSAPSGQAEATWLCTIPYKFMKNGYVWSLLSVKNDFSKPESETFVHGEYENQYGHIKQFTLKEFRA